MKKMLLVWVFLVGLAGCVVRPTSTPLPTLPPVTPVPSDTPKPITYLIILPGERAAVWPEINAQTGILGYMKDGDSAPVREKVMQGEQLWIEVLVGDLRQFMPGTTGWVKFKDYQAYLEVRQP